MLRQDTIAAVPVETVRVAHAAFPSGHRYLRLADELDVLFTDELFVSLYPSHGQPAIPPWRLALVTMSSLPKVCPIVKPWMPFVAGSTGNMSCAWI